MEDVIFTNNFNWVKKKILHKPSLGRDGSYMQILGQSASAV